MRLNNQNRKICNFCLLNHVMQSYLIGKDYRGRFRGVVVNVPDCDTVVRSSNILITALLEADSFFCQV